MAACAADASMACWVHKDSILNNDGVIQSLKEAWEINLQGLERQYWLGTEAKRLGCYDFPGETWAGDGSAHKGGMGSGSVCLQQQDRHDEVRVGREEGVNSLGPELAEVLTCD